jgi:riboflavin kinase/FMN adenylyltransferase
VRLFRSLAAVREPAARHGRVATIGVFDGLHLGHREILARTADIARQLECPTTVCSFEPMPTEFFAPSAPPARLTCFRERFELMSAAGVDELFCPHFGAVRDLSPERFIEDLLVGTLAVEHVVVGHDFRFGAGRRGTLDELAKAASAFGFGLTTVEPVFADGERISSTAIRKSLKAGDLARAREMLGRDYSMSGRVVYGRGLGKDLGFPTANVNIKRRLAPVDGIFAVRVSGACQDTLDGVASIGNRPMMGGGETLLEVHLFDFDLDIYGRYITVEFVSRLREERTFPDLAAMTEQMHADVRAAQAALGA